MRHSQEDRHRRPRALVLSILAALLLVPGQLAGAAEGTLVTVNQVQSEDFPTVVAYVTVSDESGIPITGLSSANFEAFEDGQALFEFKAAAAVDTQEGISVILAIDTSGSMKGQPIEDAKEAAKLFIRGLTANDQAAVISFSATVDLLQDFTGDKDALAAGIDALTAKGDTALYDAIYDAVGNASRLPPGRKMVLILTDGEDTESSVTLDDGIDRARELNVPVFTVGLGQVVAEPLTRLTQLTGGRYFEALSSSELSERFELISDQLRHQYVLTYRSKAPPDGQEHTLLIKASHEAKTGQDSRTFIAPEIKSSITLPGLAEGMEVAGVVDITPEIQPPDFVAQVSYSVDGVLLASVKQSPFQYRWDTGQTALGEHTLTATAQDLAGNESQAAVSLRVVPLLEVEIAFPAEGAEVVDSLTVEPSITAFHPVDSVEYLVDGNLLATVDQAPFAFEWDLAGVTLGQHTLELTVRDQQGNTATAVRRVRVVPPLSVRFASPVAGDQIEAEALLSVDVAPPGATERVEYLLDGESLAVVEQSPFSYRWQLAAVKSGSHTLAAIAYGQGQTAQDQVQVTVVQTLPLGVIFALAALALAAIPFLVIARRRRPTSIPPRAAPTREYAAPRGLEGRPLAWLVEKGGEGKHWQLGAVSTPIGRGVGPGGIVVDDPRASRRHAEIRLEEGQLVFYDLRPTNPSLINGEEYRGPWTLRDGDEVTIGETTLIFIIAP